MEQRSIQRTRRVPTRQERMTSEPDVLDEEYDDIWPTRMPSSVRRYHSDDEGGGDTRMGADVQSHYSTINGSNRYHQARRNSVPARSTATQGRVPAVQTRRTSTQSSVPAVQTHRTMTQSSVPAARGRHADRLTARARRQPVDTDDVNVRDVAARTMRDRNKREFHWLFYLGLVLLTMTLVWWALTAVSNWWQVTANDWQYGRPRTYQTDAVVGHNDSTQHPSHFIALNLNGHIQVIEFPGGDSTKAKIYIGPVLNGAGQDLTPVTLEFKDVNSDGKPDMIVKVQDSRFVFINDNGTFRTLRPGEIVHF